MRDRLVSQSSAARPASVAARPVSSRCIFGDFTRRFAASSMPRPQSANENSLSSTAK